MVNVLLWNFSRSVTSERQCQCTIPSYEDVQELIQLNTKQASKQRYNDGQSWSLRLLSFWCVLLLRLFGGYGCHFMGGYKYAQKFSKMLGRWMKQKDWVLLIRVKVWSSILGVFSYLNSFVHKAVKSVISQLCNINRNGISWFYYCLSITHQVKKLLGDKNYRTEQTFFALGISPLG